MQISLFHYPCIDYHIQEENTSMCLYGHQNNNLSTPDIFDIGVDTWNYEPVSIQEILEKYHGDNSNPYVGFIKCKQKYYNNLKYIQSAMELATNRIELV
jgi:hypothetical protein